MAQLDTLLCLFSTLSIWVILFKVFSISPRVRLSSSASAAV